MSVWTSRLLLLLLCVFGQPAPIAITNHKEYEDVEHLTKTIESLQAQVSALNNKLEGNLLNNVPLGSIVAWVPRPNRGDGHVENVPAGWIACNGGIIVNSDSPWNLQRVPNLNGDSNMGRFLRGANQADFLETEEDQVQDHEHKDLGHNHTDPGHTHEDDGHTHVDAGHDHTDSGHTHTDAGHTHQYDDMHITWPGGGWGSGDGLDRITTRRTTLSGAANIQAASANIQTGQASIQLAHAQITPTQVQVSKEFSNIGSVVEGSRFGNETRPKSANVVWIIKIAHVTSDISTN